MAREISGLINNGNLLPWPKALGNKLAKLQLYFYPSLTSSVPNYRLQLRKEIRLLFQLEVAEEQALFDLKLRPNLKERSISVTHSPAGSMILVGPKEWQIGVDLERADRLQSAIVKRVSTSKEMEASPQVGFVFVGKEAAWKALNQDLSLKTLNQIETLAWQAIDSTYWRFQVRWADQIVDGYGLCWEKQGSLCAIFARELNF